MNFERIAQMKVGDVFYECESGINIRARVTEAPVSDSKSYDGRRQLRWKAENTENGEPISYLLTEGVGHYGPRIYDQPQYARLSGGDFVFPLYGADDRATPHQGHR